MHSTSKPVKFVFQPLTVEAKFQKNLKFQIAIFRTLVDQRGKRPAKMDKTDPMKFTSPGPIELTHKLSLLTTLGYSAQTKSYQSKQVEFQMALDLDGNKQRMNKKINLRDVIGSVKHGKFRLDTPQVVLTYKMEVVVEGGEEKPQRHSRATKEVKVLKFEEDYLSNGRQDFKENVKADTGESKDKSRFRTVVQNPSGQKIAQEEYNTQQSQQKMKRKKSKSLNRQSEKQQALLVAPINGNPLGNSADIIKTDQPSYSPSAQKANTEQGSVNSQFSKSKHQKMSKKMIETEAENIRLTARIEELQQKVQNEQKTEKSIKQMIKKQQTLKANYQVQIANLKEEIKTYKAEVSKLSVTAQNYQQCSQNIMQGNEQEVKNLREKLRILERMNQDAKREGQYYETNLRDKDEVINDLKGKIYNLDKQNLEHTTTIKALEHKLQKINRQHKLEIQQLQQSLKQLKNDNRELRMPSSRNTKDDPIELKKKIQTMEKQIQRKQELLKRMTDLKKQADSQRTIQNQNLKQQIWELKQTIQRLQSKQSEDASSTTSIQYRVQMQRMKKELQTYKRSETKLLIEKTRLQNTNNDLKDEVVKQKLKIANILNAVQQTGDQKLISQCYSCTQ